VPVQGSAQPDGVRLQGPRSSHEVLLAWTSCTQPAKAVGAPLMTGAGRIHNRLLSHFIPLLGGSTGERAFARRQTAHTSVMTISGFAVAVVREDGRWQCSKLDAAALRDLDAAITELRGHRSTGAVFGLLDVDDEFFVVVRPVPGGVALLLSDAAAALDYDIAADVLDLLRVEVPDEDSVDADDVWPEGDLGLLADVGLPAEEMQVIIDEVDLYPDEQLDMIAQRCGFQPQLSALLAKQPG
jgi:putative tRNA adenosine deaminase-associated protein